MRDIREALRAWLLADSGVSALVGGNRIHSVRLPQGQRTASIVYNRISESGDYHMQGPSGLIRTRFQIDCWAPRQDEVVNLADRVKDRLDALRGTRISWGSDSPTEQITVQGSFLDTGREDYDSTADMYRMSRDYLIWYGSGE